MRCFHFWYVPGLLPEGGQVFCYELSEIPLERGYILGKSTRIKKRLSCLEWAPVSDAIKDKIKLNNNCVVGYTPFLSLEPPIQ
jgi:hypothetical protein